MGSPFGAFPSQEVLSRFRASELTYRFTQQFLRRPKAPARPDGSRFLSFHPLESSSRPDVCLARRAPDAPLGLPLLGYARDNLYPDFAGSPLSCLGRTTRKPPPAPQSIDQLPTGSIRKRTEANHGQSDPCRVSRQYDPEHSTSRDLRAMGSPRTTLNITVMSWCSLKVP
jgi:hypothetical protein